MNENHQLQKEQAGAVARPIDLPRMFDMAMERGPEGVQMLKELVVLRREMEEEAAKREYTAAMVKQGISKIEIFPLDADRPFGIAANYYDADGECFWTQSFDRNDSAEWIRECVFNALKEGVQNRIEASRKKKKGTKYE